MDEERSRLERNIAEMALAKGQMARAQTRVDEAMAAMLDTHNHTMNRLDAFIGVLERETNEGRNGQGNRVSAPDQDILKRSTR
ncbi:MAG: hypothetical protein QOJ64_614 [Acidobacteriota bacterium]|jgi:hypothetical protein|nr:hypothetical protein [Acidobacteriota bacterium]